MEKISYERRVYESVDDTNVSWVASQISTDNRIDEEKGWMHFILTESVK